ncbi:hypothetical protein LguiA_030244 [Lonicera macranthoides]
MLLLVGASMSWLRYSNVRTREGNWFFLYSTTLIHFTFVNKQRVLKKLFAGYEEEKEAGYGCEIKKWRAALTEAANLSGWDLQNYANGNWELFLIEKNGYKFKYFLILTGQPCLLSKLRLLVVDNCKNLQSFPKLPPKVVLLYMNDCTSVERLPDLSNCEKPIFFHLRNCSSFTESHDMVNFNTVKGLHIYRHSNMVRNFIDCLSQVDAEHAGLPGPIRNKKISSALFDILATTVKTKTFYFI